MPRQRRAEDEIFRVHGRFIIRLMGVPFSVTYRALLPGIAAGIGVLVLLSVLGTGLWRFLIAAAAGLAVGAVTDRYSSADRPVRSLPSILSHETAAPRPGTRKAVQMTLRPGSVPVHPPRGTPRTGGRQ